MGIHFMTVYEARNIGEKNSTRKLQLQHWFKVIASLTCAVRLGYLPASLTISSIQNGVFGLREEGYDMWRGGVFYGEIQTDNQKIETKTLGGMHMYPGSQNEIMKKSLWGPPLHDPILRCLPFWYSGIASAIYAALLCRETCMAEDWSSQPCMSLSSCHLRVSPHLLFM